MKRFFTSAFMFLSILLIPIICADVLLKEKAQNTWFKALAIQLKTSPPKYTDIFVGTSIMAAAVSADQFATTVSAKTGQLRQGTNMGQGYSTVAEYLYGFKEIVKTNATALQNMNVYIEAPGGLPAFETWTDNWMNPNFPNLLSQYIDWPGLQTYCTTCDVPASDKALLIGSYFSTIISYGPQIQAAIPETLDRLLDAAFPQKVAAATDLTSAGGIATRGAQIKFVRDRAKKMAQKNLRNQKPVDWNKTVLRDLVAYLQSQGANVYFVQLPLSTVMLEPLDTPIRKQDRANFAAMADDWHCKFLRPQFSAADQDFPDLLHLRNSLMDKFTLELAQTYLAEND